MIGDLAPQFRVSKFLSGTEIRELRRNKIYIIEFWATWCNACFKSISHLSYLQNKYPSICVVGISVKESDEKNVVEFVKNNRKIINYAMATDLVEMGSEKGWMAENWCGAAHINTIPTAFIVDADTRIAWIGHPAEIDAPLSLIINGSWDIDRADKQFRHSLTTEYNGESSKLIKLVEKYKKENDTAGAIKVYTEFFQKNPELEKKFGKSKLALMIADNSKCIKDYSSYLISDLYRNSRRDKIMVGSLIVNDVINTAELNGHNPDSDLVMHAYDILMKEDIDDFGNADTTSSMLINASIALILINLNRHSEALARAKFARYMAVEANAEYMLAPIDEIIRKCIV